jgi:hypothetical protein
MIVWFVVAVIVGRIVIAIFPPTDPTTPPLWLPGSSFSFGVGLVFKTASGKVPIGIDLHWWNLPGTIMGAILGFVMVRPYCFRRAPKT